MKCNIDSRGKMVRLFIGANVEGVGFLLIALWYANMLPPWAAIVGAIAAAAGLALVFEGLTGWCAIRAMGVKTPL